jgi:hypothetical protein
MRGRGVREIYEGKMTPQFSRNPRPGGSIVAPRERMVGFRRIFCAGNKKLGNAWIGLALEKKQRSAAFGHARQRSRAAPVKRCGRKRRTEMGGLAVDGLSALR